MKYFFLVMGLSNFIFFHSLSATVFSLDNCTPFVLHAIFNVERNKRICNTVSQELSALKPTLIESDTLFTSPCPLDQLQTIDFIFQIQFKEDILFQKKFYCIDMHYIEKLHFIFELTPDKKKLVVEYRDKGFLSPKILNLISGIVNKEWFVIKEIANAYTYPLHHYFPSNLSYEFKIPAPETD